MMEGNFSELSRLNQVIQILGEIRDLLKAVPARGAIVTYHDKFVMDIQPKKRKRK